MAEHEVIKHTREVVKVLKKPDTFKHKIKDTILEIAIIVFAITLSLIVERWRESSAEHTLEHNFLSNLVNDLKADEEQLKQDSASYVKMRDGFRYLRSAYMGKQLQHDSALRSVDFLYNGVSFVPSNSRYEALKASGKLDVIEDKNLQVEIVNLYQQTIPSLIASTTQFSDFKNRLGDYADYHLVIKGDKNNIQQVMESPVTYNLLDKDGFMENIIQKYVVTLKETRNIIRKIEAEEK